MTVNVLVTSTPEITALPLDCDNHRLIHKPRVSQSALAFVKRIGRVRTEFHALLSKGPVCNDDPSPSPQTFEVFKSSASTDGRATRHGAG